MTREAEPFVLNTPVLLIGFNRVGPLRMVFEAIRQLMAEQEDRVADDVRQPIGFKTK